MRYKKSGNSDLETSVVGFGGWPMDIIRNTIFLAYLDTSG